MSDNRTDPSFDDQPQPPGISVVKDRDIEIPAELALMAVDNFVLYPYMIAPMVVDQEHLKRLVHDSLQGERMLGVFLKRDSAKVESFDNLYEVGCLAMVLKMLRMPDGSMRLLLHGIERIRIAERQAEEPYLKARVEKMPDLAVESKNVRAMVKSVQGIINKIVQMGHLPEDLGRAINEMQDAGKLADLAVSHLSVKIEERQEILELADVEKRLDRVLQILAREANVFELGSEIQTKVMGRMDQKQREYILREQIKAIRKELGEEGEENPDIKELGEAIAKAKMPDHAREAAEKELRRLNQMHPSSPEYSVSRTYLDWLVTLPWSKSTRDNIDLGKARRILDEDHFDLSDVKERILEHLAVIKLKKKIRGPILCFVGPPGVGKTSLGRSIARAMGRKFYRISLGGMRDEAEIRGHRRTYIGSLPGRIVKGIRDCDSNNPLMMLDEVDKIGTDFRGDPASALLEVLDPEQNFSFTDHYLDMAFDLSHAMFITTANLLEPIAPALLDRMEVLRLSGYTSREKMEIAKRYLIPRTYENTGVSRKSVEFTDEGLETLIEEYTREAGVRNLEREIGNICRKVARRLASGRKTLLKIDRGEVGRLLGPKPYYREMAGREGQVGVATGLAVNQYGGEILFLEASAMPGNGTLVLTGQLGEVMKESAVAAMDYLRSNAESLGVAEEAFAKRNIHVHVPAGATPKDGPSAGIAIASALCSLILDKPVRDHLAMTGEITLKGNVLPIGGVKEKVLAAHRSGIKAIILPTHCRANVEKDVPTEVKNAVRFHYVDHVSQVLEIALGVKIQTDVRPVRSTPRVTVQEAKRTEEPIVEGKVLRIEPEGTSRHSRGRHGKSSREPVAAKPDEKKDKADSADPQTADRGKATQGASNRHQRETRRSPAAAERRSAVKPTAPAGSPSAPQGGRGGVAAPKPGPRRRRSPRRAKDKE
ncbi:endopeptidase La [Candidatus Sumerlaeota bacterium]|nr:endopeptidase La [Candidatus Sumerlaeota bacterium]